MNPSQTNAGSRSGIQKVSNIDLLNDKGKNTALLEILQTREVRQAIGDTLPDILYAYAGDSRIKGFLMKVFGGFVHKSLSRPGDGVENIDLLTLFQDERFIRNLFRPLPNTMNGLMEGLTVILRSVEQLQPDEKSEVLDKLFSAVDIGQAGDAFTRFSRIMSDVYREHPEFLTKTISPNITELIEKTDFGEAKEFFDHLTGDLARLVSNTNDSMFECPTKVIVLLTLIPTLINTLFSVADDTVKRFNGFPPDMLADVVLSLMNRVDADTAGKLLNETMELSRKLNTGSALLGEIGAPKFRNDAEVLIQDVLGQIDIEMLWKFKEAMEQGKDTLNHCLIKAFRDNPEMAMIKLRRTPLIKNYKLKRILDALEFFEELPEKEIADTLSEGLSELDVDSLAEAANLLAILFNRIQAQHPELLPKLVHKFTNALDTDECEEAIKSIIDEIGKGFKPIGSRIMPHLLGAIGQWMTPEDDKTNGDLELVRDKVINFK